MLSLQAPPQYGQAQPQAQPQVQPQQQNQNQNQGQGQGQNQGAYGSSSNNNNNNGNNSNQGAYGGEAACLTWRVLCLLLPYSVCCIPYAADSPYFSPMRSYLHVILLQHLHVLAYSFPDLSHCSSTFLTNNPLFPATVRTCTGSAYGGQANSRPVARDDGAVGNIVPISAINPYSNKYVRTESSFVRLYLL